MPRLVKAAKDFDKAKAQKILDTIDKEEKKFKPLLKKYNKLLNQHSYSINDDMTIKEFEKLADDLNKASDAAISKRKEINKLKEEFKKLTGTETFRASDVGLTASVEKAANEANLFDSKSLVAMITRELSKHNWLKIKVLENKTDPRELTVEIKETPELGIDHFLMKSIYDLHKKLDQKARQQGYFGLDTMLLIKSKSTAHLIMSTLDGD